MTNDTERSGTPAERDPALAETMVAQPSVAPGPDAPAVGAQVGRYRIVERLGGGGMGVVYVAHDPELDRRVAIKLLRADAAVGDDPSVGRARLLREAQAMARLSHPNVIAVHDVGTCEGQVFIAMELVDGQTLSSWLSERPRSWRETRDLFVHAGRGLAAAHAAGLIHRDFKPDNVLVGRDGRVKVLDFGLARTAEGSAEPPPSSLRRGPSSAPLTSLTQEGTVMGTPHYMAPEQFAGRAMDARTDQFAFCVALFEALHGQHPFDTRDYFSLARSASEGRVLEPGRGRRVPAWLDRVVRRGLSTAPAARFPSMDALLKALGQDPRARLLRGLVAAAALLGLLAVAWGAARARRERDLLCKGAEQEIAGSWSAEKRGAVHRAFVASGKPFAEASFQAASAALDAYAAAWARMHGDACEATRLRGEQSEELLDLRMECLSARRQELGALTDTLAGGGEVVVRALESTRALGDLRGCADVAALRAPLRPPSDPASRAKIAQVRELLARARALGAVARYADGLVPADRAVAEARALHYRPLEAEALLQQGGLLRDGPAPLRAVEVLIDAVAAAEAGHDDRAAAWTLTTLGGLFALQSRADQAEPWLRLAEAKLERLGGDEEIEAQLLNNQGVCRHSQGRLAEALELHRRALAWRERHFGPGHPRVADSHVNLGSVYLDLRRYAEALAEYRLAEEILEKALGVDHPDVAAVLDNIGVALNGLHRFEEELGFHQRALRTLERSLGPDHRLTANARNNVGEVLARLGHDDEALAQLLPALATYEKAFGPDDPEVCDTLANLARVYLAQRRFDEALGAGERASAILEAHHVEGADRATNGFVLGRALWESGRDRARGRRLVEQARAFYAGAGPGAADDVTELDGWLKEHR